MDAFSPPIKLYMKFEKIRDLLDGIPYTGPVRGKSLYEFILAHRPERCLELGFAHGVASSYIAAALDETGKGRAKSVPIPGF
jgi:predicted O-methyltransferase YrrM